jgi:hypothetical protein
MLMTVRVTIVMTVRVTMAVSMIMAGRKRVIVMRRLHDWVTMARAMGHRRHAP